MSFLSLQDSVNLKSKVNLKVNGALKELETLELKSQMTRKKRFTQDDRGCSSAFVQDGKTYFDCTKARSPDGEMNNKEWCYIDNPAPGTKNWDYCKPIMDYDKVRKSNQEILKDITKTCNQVDSSIKQNIIPAQNALDDVKVIQKGQAELDNNINNLTKSINNINLNLITLNRSKDLWEKQQAKTAELEFEIGKKKSKEESENKVTTKCEGMLLYEDEALGDGLIGHYYNNENWLGSYVEVKDRQIDFDWTGTSPHHQNPNNFSVIWEGFLLTPATQEYTFVINADDGAELEINNEKIIEHRLKTPIEIPTTIQHPFSTRSKKVKLFGGTKVKVLLKYYHSIHSDVNDDGLCFIKLYWANDDFHDMVIPKQYLYSSNSFPPLKVTGFNSNISELKKLYENDVAFKNSDRYILQDIPSEFIGSTTLKMNTRIQDNMIKFYVNTPAIVYIAFLSHYPFFLPDEYENTSLFLSLLQVDKSLNRTAKVIVAKKSGKMLIYKKKYAMGWVKIPLKKEGINKKGVPVVLFYGFDSKANAPIECGGQILVVSNSTSKYFASCSASTEKDHWKCADGFNLKNRDEEGGMWASNNEGIGAWVQVNFKGLYEITSFQYKDRKNPAERNSLLQLTFSNGETQDVSLKNTDDLMNFKVDHIKATSVRITIKGVYGTMNNGGAFGFKAIKCKSDSDDDEENSNSNDKAPTALFVKTNIKLNTLNCRESFSNSYKFDNVIFKPSNKISVKCPESCVNSDNPVYGSNGKYTKDSAICRSAYHAGKLSSKGGLVTIVFNKPITNYKGNVSHGIISEGRAKSEFSLAFETYVEDDVIQVKSGSKVDFANLNGKSGWKPGIITGVIDNDNGKFLKIIFEGESSQQIEIKYPDKDRIHPCGTHLKERNCKDSLKVLTDFKPIKIRFVPYDYQNPGEFLPDIGQTMEESGKSYGWSKSMKNKIFLRGNYSKPELETFVEFPPSNLSRYCNKPIPDTLCEPVTWKVFAGEGRFIVKLFIGDPEEDARLDLKVNDKFVAQNMVIPKNKMKIIEEIVETKHGYITLMSECKKDCDLAKSKLNAIEIFPAGDDDDPAIKKTPEKAYPCGKAFKGGRCDTGPDVLHCIFDDPNNSAVKYCSGTLSLISIPPEYKCKEQVGKFKCIKQAYLDDLECKHFCPQECSGSKCLY